MRTISKDYVETLYYSVGFREPIEPISQPSGNNQVHAAWLLEDGSVYEMIKVYYNQGLWKYIYCLYDEGEVHGKVRPKA
jgi:hypothetical protein